MHEPRIRVLFLCDATDTGIVHACCACLLPSFCWYCHGRHGGMTRLSWSGWLVTYTDMICPPGDGYPLKVSEDLPWKSPEIAVVDSPTIVSRPIPRNRCEYPHISYFWKPVIVLHFCRWLYGSIFIHIFVVGFKRGIFAAIDCVSAVQGHPSVQGRWFWYQSKARERLPVSLSL